MQRLHHFKRLLIRYDRRAYIHEAFLALGGSGPHCEGAHSRRGPHGSAGVRRACKAAGIVHRHPHDLRHRHASVKIAEGVPVTQVAAQLGHSKKSLTLDVYAHVLLDSAHHGT